MVYKKDIEREFIYSVLKAQNISLHKRKDLYLVASSDSL